MFDIFSFSNLIISVELKLPSLSEYSCLGVPILFRISLKAGMISDGFLPDIGTAQATLVKLSIATRAYLSPSFCSADLIPISMRSASISNRGPGEMKLLKP